MFDFRNYGDGIYAFDAGYIRPLLAAVHIVVEKGRAALIDTGTNETLPTTLGALAQLGISGNAVDYVILSHIHLDHAGGAGGMMQAFPHARLVVHPRGAKHMIEPSRLVAGVIDVYGREYVERVYGAVLPVDRERIVEAQDGATIDLAGRRLLCLDTPGHARHHICIVDQRTGGIFTGDMFGLSYREMDANGRQFIFPTTTPTQFEPDAMRQSIDRLMSFSPSAMYLTHYGQVKSVPQLRDDLIRHLEQLVALAQQEAEIEDGRVERIKSRMAAYLLREARQFGCVLEESELLAIWEGDLQLNAQGLDAWLQGCR